MTEYNGLYTPSKGWCGYTHIGDMVYIYNSIDSTMDIKKYELEYYYPNQVIKSEDRAYFEFLMPNKRNTLKTFSNVKVHLPDSFQNEEDINVFVSKNERVSGFIYCKIANVKTKKNENEITFSYTGGSYNCMMKILMPSYLFGDIEEVSYIYTLPELVSYENSRKSLQEVIWDEFIKRTIPVVIVGISIYIIVIKIFFGKKGKLYNSLKNSKKRKKYKYYRNVDIGNMTPLEAWVLTNNEFRHIPSKDFENIITATILYLKLIGDVELKKESQETKIKVIERSVEKQDTRNRSKKKQRVKKISIEEKILYFIKNIIQEMGYIDEEIKILEIQEYIKQNPQNVIKLYKDVEDSIIEEFKARDLLNKTPEYIDNYLALDNHYNGKFERTAGFHLITNAIHICFYFTLLMFSDLGGILSIIACTLISRKYIKGNIREKELLNEKGIEESEKYHGLKRFLKDFSVIHDKELIEVELWEKYLMYAIVFGETKKIVKQMGLDYPDCDSFFLLRYNFK